MDGTYVRTSLRRKRTPGDAHRRFTFFRPSFLVFINSRERPLRIHRQQDHGIRDQVRCRLMLRSDALVLLTEMVYPELPVKEMCSILRDVFDTGMAGFAHWPVHRFAHRVCTSEVHIFQALISSIHKQPEKTSLYSL